METKYVFKNKKHLAYMNDMRLAGQLCDVTINVNGRELQAHKNVLAANLKYFKSMFLNGGFQDKYKENVVTIKNLEENCFELFLTYAYTGKLVLTKSNALGVLKVANYLDEDTIKKECVNFLEKHLEISDACRAYQFAKAIECVPLKTVSKTRILLNFEYCSQTAEYLDFDCDSLKKILCDINLYPKLQQSFFEGIIRWILHDMANRKIYVKDLLNLIDMSKLASDHILKYFCGIMKDQRDFAADIMMIYHEKAQKPTLNQNLENEANVCHKNMQEFKNSNHSLIIVGILDKTLKMQLYDFTKQKWCQPRDILDLKEVTIDKWASFRDQFYYTVIESDRSNTIVTRLQVLNPSTKQNTMLAFDRRLLRNSAMCACTEMLYFCGGETANSDDVSNQVLRYDPRTNHFETLPPMRTKRAGAAAIFYQGCILVLGGYDERREVIESVEKYDSVTNQWVIFPSMLEPRKSFEVALLDGKLYACGGAHSWCNYGEVYDPSIEKWRLVSSIDGNKTYPLMIPREGKLLYIGSDRKKSFRVYDPCDDLWVLDRKMSTGLQLNIFGGFVVPSSVVN